mgnify:CR=1 FL=1|jgi:hypothetical protein
MKKIYAKASHSFYYFLFLLTHSITVLKMEKKYGKVSHSFHYFLFFTYKPNNSFKNGEKVW